MTRKAGAGLGEGQQLAQGHPAALPKGGFLNPALGFNPGSCGGWDCKPAAHTAWVWTGVVGLERSRLIPRVPLHPSGSCSGARSWPSTSFVCEENKKTRSQSRECPMPCVFFQREVAYLCAACTHTHARTHSPQMHTSPHSWTETCPLLTKHRIPSLSTHPIS